MAERIDHEEAKRIAEKWQGHFEPGSDQRIVGDGLLALLTEHSARDYALVQVEYLLDPATGSPRPTEALRVARRALPATEPAQPEEEPDA